MIQFVPYPVNTIRTTIFATMVNAARRRPVMTPGARLRQAREIAGFPQIKDVIDRFGWKRSAYSHHENGIREFGVQDAIKYGRAFKVSAWWLLSGVVEPRGSSDLTEDEQSLINKYRGASDALREAAHAVLTPKPKASVTAISAKRKAAS